MVAVLVIIVAVLVFLALSRVGVLTARREQRSIEHYWEAMGVLAQMSARERGGAAEAEAAPDRARSEGSAPVGRPRGQSSAPKLAALLGARRATRGPLARVADALRHRRRVREGAQPDGSGAGSGAGVRGRSASSIGSLATSRRPAGRSSRPAETTPRPVTAPAVAERRPAERRRPVPSPVPPPRVPPAVPPPRVPPPVRPSGPLVFVDDGDDVGASPTGSPPVPERPRLSGLGVPRLSGLDAPRHRLRARRRTGPAHRRPGDREAARTRRWAVVAASGACAVAVVVAAALVLGGRSGPIGRQAPSAATVRGAAAQRTARAPVVTLVSEDASSAAYAVHTSPVVVVLGATGPCWVEARAGQGGPLLFEGTLAAGATKTLTAGGAVWVRVGDAAHIDVAANGVPVPEAPVGPNPYDFSFSSTSPPPSAAP